jgi:imidazolonepropionase
MTLLIENASEILTMKTGLNVLKNASIFVEKGTIKHIGSAKRIKKQHTRIDAHGCVVCPGFVDSHTHLVYGGSREDEFALRVTGVKYEKIAKSGGGITSTVRETRKASEAELFDAGMQRLDRITRHGTTTVEIKSGYGLNLQEEIKMLRVIRELKKNSCLDIVPTYLVHTVPQHMKRKDYIALVTKEVLPEVTRQKLASFCDIFCDKIAFTKKESRAVLLKAKELGMGLKIHADQFANIGAAHLAAELKCISAEHLEYTTVGAIKKMKKAGVIPTLLPGATFFLQMKKKPNIRAYTETKTHVALASDYNPGSCMIYSMPKIVSLACISYGMRVEDALLAATKYGAKALNVYDRLGSIEVGKQADLVVFNVDRYKKIPYHFGEDVVKYTIKKGRVIYGKDS